MSEIITMAKKAADAWRNTDTYHQAAQIIDMLVEELERKPTLTPLNEWVRVEERLPENGQIVLFHQKDGFIYCAEYFVGKELMSPEWFIDNDSWNAKVVTHWMPLPAPPELERKPTLTPLNEWVRVEERLPENGQIVLFHQKDGFIYCAEYFVGKELMSPEWFIDNDSWNAKVVTHWMPLPAPPEKENSHE